MNQLNWDEIGVRLKALRKNNGITIERLCEIVGVSTSFIGLIERGDSKISIDKLFKLSQAFGVSVDYILTGNNLAAIENPYSRFEKLNVAIYDYSEEEIDFLIELSKFLKQRVSVKE